MSKKFQKKTLKWKTKEGKMLSPSEMETSHINNIISMLERNCKKLHSENLSFYLSCTGPSGDMAQLCFDQEVDFWIKSDWDDLLPEIYYSLKEELDLRN